MLFGPVFHSELLMTARRRRYYVVRVLYGLFLLFSLRQRYVEWASPDRWLMWRRSFGLDPTASIKAMALFAGSAFVGFAWAQGVAILCVLPALLAGVIADEHQRKTLHYLLGSRLSSFEIVVGKLAARLLHVGVLLTMGVPIVCLVALFGGLDPWEVAYVYAGTFSMTLSVAGLSMLVSVVANRPRSAIVAAYLLEAAWLFLPPILKSISTHIEPTLLGWVLPVNDLVRLTNPIHAYELVANVANANEFDMLYPGARFARAPGIGGVSPFLIMVALQAAFGLGLLGLAIRGLRPLRGGGGRWERRRTVWFPNLRKLGRSTTRPCGEDPMVWKERFAGRGGGLGWLSSLPVVLVVGLVLGAFVLEQAAPAFREFASAREWGRGDRYRNVLNGTVRQCSFFAYVLLLVAVASASAVSVTSEREQDTWTSLTTTLLTGREIVLAKIRGALWGSRRLVWMLCGLWLVGVAAGAVHPLGALASALGLAVFGWFTSALGVFISLRAKSSIRSLAITFVALLVVNGGYLLLVTPLLEQWPLLAAGATPYVEVVALVTYRQALPLADGRAPGFSGMGPDVQVIATMFAISLVAYASASLAITAAACRAYERVVDRPRRPAAPVARPDLPGAAVPAH